MTDVPEELIDSLRRMSREQVPPAHLEDSTVSRLRHASLLGPPPGRRRMLVAASVLFAFWLGWATANAGTDGATPPPPTFALMLYGGPPDDDSTHVALAAEYAAWAAADHGEVAVVGGEALGAPDDLVVPPDVRMVIPAQAPVGFFLVQAPTIEAASRLARQCPHLKHGGLVVVQAIRPT